MKSLKRLAAPMVSVLLLSGCSTLPDVVVKDQMADDRTRYFAQKGVRVVKPEHAKQFDDPAWPTPIQVVAPRRESDLKRISGTHEIYLFNDSGKTQRIERLYVENAKLDQCRAALDGIGLPHREHKPAFIRVGEGGGNLIRCGSVVIESDTQNLEFRHPFVSTYLPIELADLAPMPGQTATEPPVDRFPGDDVRLYPIIIRYLND